MLQSKPKLTDQQIVLLIEKPDERSSLAFVNTITNVREAAEELQDRIFILDASRDKINRTTVVPKWLSEVPCVVYGSVQFIRDIKIPLKPGAYGVKGTDWNSLVAHYPRDSLFNSDFMIVKWSEVPVYHSELFRSNFMFIRPVSNNKIFAGQTISCVEDLAAIDATSGVQPDTLCVIAAARLPEDESRHFIVGGRVVGEVGINTQTVHPKASSTARLIASMHWQPDSCYVVDLMYSGTTDSVSIIEMNPFSSSGLYGFTRTVEILEALVDQALCDYRT